MSDYEEIRNALDYLDPHDRLTWLRMGAALKDELGEDGFNLWDTWSQQAENYKTQDAKYTWNRSIKTGRVSIGSLYYEATKNGFQHSQQYKPPTTEEIEQRQARAKARQEADAVEVAKGQAKAKSLANYIWSKGEKADPSHPYLIAKGITDEAVLNSIRQNSYKGQDNLLIPVIHEKEIVSMQFIGADGDKKFISGGQVGGAYHLVGDASKWEEGLILAEGYATAASINQATGKPVVVAFNAGNLVSVAERLSQKLPEHVPVIIAADNDASLTGITKANEAAAYFGDRAKVIMPEFNQSLIEKYQTEHGQDKLPSDFNDLHQLTSVENVRRSIEPDHLLSERAPWNDFPPVIRNGDLKELSNEPEYAAAKAGDEHKAGELIGKLINDETLNQLKELIGDRKPIIVPILADETAGKNKIPLATADLIAHELNLEVSKDIVQINHVGRTGTGIDHRFAHQPMFSGEVDADKEYLIIDDTLSVGGTIAAARGYIENRGGKVLGAAVMTAHEGAVNIAVKSNMLDGIKAKHGDTMNEDWKGKFGYDIDRLTQGEAGHIKAAQNVDQLRDRIATAGNEKVLGVSEGIFSENPPEKIAYENPISTPSPEAANFAASSFSEAELENIDMVYSDDDYFDPDMVEASQQYFNQEYTAAELNPPIEFNSIEFDEFRAPEREEFEPEFKEAEPFTAPQSYANDQPEQTEFEPVAPVSKKLPPILDLQYKAPPAELEHRYLVAGGKYLSKQNAQTVLFTDTGKKISTGLTDQQTMQDMLKVAQSKGWNSIKLTGTPEFKQKMFVLAEAQGIQTSGYKPTEQDLALVEQQRQQLSLNGIEQGKLQPKQELPQEAKFKPAVDAATISDANKLISQNEKPTLAQINTSELVDTHLGQSVDNIGLISVPAEVSNAAQDLKAQAPNVELATAKSTYMTKADRLSKSSRAKLMFYERTAMRAIEGLDDDHKTHAMRNYYEDMSKNMSGSKLNTPDPLQIPNTQATPTHDLKQDKDHDIER